MGTGFGSAVSFKSKYIAVAVIAAIVVSLAVGFVLVLAEPRATRRCCWIPLRPTPAQRVQGELSLRAAEIAQRIAERVRDEVLTGDRAAHQRPTRDLQERRHAARRAGPRRRRTRAVRLAAQRRPSGQHHAQHHHAGARQCADPAGHRDAADRWRSRSRDPLAGGLAGFRRRAAPASIPWNAARSARRCWSPPAWAAWSLLVGFALAWWAGRRMHQPITYADQERRPHRARRLFAAAGSRQAR